MLFSSFLGAAATTLAVANSVTAFTATPFVPPSFPLAVRSPYTSTWLPGGTGGSLAGTWPVFWQRPVTGWAGYVKVDGTTYTFLGAPSVAGATLATQKSSNFTSTKSIFVLSAGPVDVTASFLSPIEPTDFVRQSFPFSYFSVSVKSTDGKAHSVQVYSDISGEWVSTDTSKVVTWGTTIDSTIVAHQVQLQTPTSYSEVNDLATWGSAYYAVLNSGSVTYATGADADIRASFIANGKLANTKDTGYRAINNRWPVLGLAKDLGSVTDTTSSPVVFAVGHARSPSISYRVKGGSFQDRYPYWASQYATPLAVLDFMLGTAEYNRAVSASNTLDLKIQNDGLKISADYANILALSARQALGGTEITISKSSSGAWNTGDVYIFMKEISSDGNVNTVDVLFPMWPIFLYLNPIMGAYALAPLFVYQQSGEYPNKWAVHDLGSHYPYVDAHNDGKDEAMQVEESGNMIIMALSYAQKSGDNSQISATYTLLKQWAGYLVSDSLVPGSQLSTDDFEGTAANQTNLAIKGVIGIRAMGEIATRLGNTADATYYNNIATSYVPQLLKYATSTDGSHLTLLYGNQNLWGTTYNLLADKLLKLNLFDSSVYSKQTAWYSSHISAYGMMLDNRNPSWSKSDWQIWTAATVTDTALRNKIVNGVARRAADGQDRTPFSDLFNVDTGGNLRGDGEFINRPVVGGHFALLVV